jgi:hypothetical protein
MRKHRTFIFGCCFGGLAALTSWFIISPNSPVQSIGGAVAGFFSVVQLPATFLAIPFSGNVHGGAAGERIYWLLVFLEWSILGFTVATLYRSLKSDEKT